MNHAEFLPDLVGFESRERLKSGIWPKSLVFWLGLFYMATVVIRPWEKLIPELAPFRFERVLGITMVMVVAMSYKWEVRGGLITLAILFFVSMMFLTAQFAVWPELCERDLTAMISTTISFFVIVFITRTTYQLQFVLFAYVGIVFVYISKAQWEYFFNGAAMYMMGVRRLAGIEYYYEHPNAVGSTVVCALPIAYYLYQVRHEFTRTWPKVYRKWFPWFLRFFACVSISGILLTRSRTAAIGLVAFAGMATFSVSQGLGKKLQRIILVGTVFVAGFLFLPGDIQGRIQTIWDPSVEASGEHRGAEESKQGRIIGFIQGIKMFEAHPWTGVGLANYKEYRQAKGDGTYLDAHNLAAEVLSETGLLGTTAFVSMLGIVFWTLMRSRKKLKRLIIHPDAPTLILIGLACLQVLGLLLLQGLASHNLHRYNWFWLAAFAAICARQTKLAVREEPDYQDAYDAELNDHYEAEEELSYA